MRAASLPLEAFGFASLALVACVAPGSGPQAPPSESASGSTSGVDAPLPSPLPEIVARLDGEPVYLRQVTPLVRAKLDKVGGRATEKPALVREALREYLDRELLLREAMAKGVEPDKRQLQQLYDRARAEFTDETQWEQSLVGRGLDPQSFKVELRVQQTVSLLVARESGTEAMGATEEAMSRRAAAARSLLERLRARSRIETYL